MTALSEEKSASGGEGAAAVLFRPCSLGTTSQREGEDGARRCFYGEAPSPWSARGTRASPCNNSDSCEDRTADFVVALPGVSFCIGGGLFVQSCLTLCHPMDHSLPGSSVHGILQARILEWVAMPSSKGSSRPRDQTCISCIGRQIVYH